MLEQSGFISADSLRQVDPAMIWNFFNSDIGQKLRSGAEIIREFKFSILEDGSLYDKNLLDDRILLQGVVDCAVLEPDGITVIDFKTDKVSEESLSQVTEQYRAQVQTYANALSKIYRMNVKAAVLYFFKLNRFVSVL